MQAARTTARTTARGWTRRIAAHVAVLAAMCLAGQATDAQATAPRRKPGPTTAKPKPSATGSGKSSTASKTAPQPAAPPKADAAPAVSGTPAASAVVVAEAPVTRTPVRPVGTETRDTPWFAHPKRAWFTIGLATANGGLGCAICRPNQTRAVAANAAAGWAIRPRLVLGLQGQTWLDVFGDGFDQTMLHGQAVARWYPFARQPLSLTGGVGALAYRVDDGAFVLRAQTVAAQFTVGWELPARAGMTVTPFVSLLTTAPARLRGANGFALAEDARFGLVQGGVALSWF
jgi:hypothetical protein